MSHAVFQTLSPVRAPRRFTPAPGLRLQRKCSCGGACADCRRQEEKRSAPAFANRVGYSLGELPIWPPGFIGDDIDAPAQMPGGEGAVPAAGGGGGGGTRRRGGSCAAICDRAYADSSLNGGGGGVICLDSAKCPCVFDVPPLRRGQCPGFDAIVLRHERAHLGDVDCNPTGGLHRPPFRDPSQALGSECTHRRASIAEMDAIIPRARGICRTGMESIRALLNTWVTANCGAP